MHRGGGSATAGSKACFFAARDMFWPSSGTAAASAGFPRVVTMTTMMTTNEIVPDERWCPVAYVTMQDTATRAEIVSVLERSGWAVVPQPTGFHLIQAISGVIEGHQTWLRPSMIVIDARSRGCSGVTIAAGLRDLGITIPIVLIAAAGDALPVSSDETLRIVDDASAKSAVAELATAAGSVDPDTRQPAA